MSNEAIIMRSTTPPTAERSKAKVFLKKIIRCICALIVVVFSFLLNLIVIVAIISYIHGGYTLRGCFEDFICDVGELVGHKKCLGLTGRYTVTYGKLDYTLKEQWLCHEQKVHMSRRCYLPHFINKQYEKYKAQQRGEEFYGDEKNCRDIEIQGNGEKK